MSGEWSMNNTLHTDVVSVATLTPQGIVFRGRKYSCSEAISQQWFATSEIPTKIPIMYSKNKNVIYIKLDNGDRIPAFLLRHPDQPGHDELNAYFQKINQLKLKRSKTKSKS